MVKRKLSLNVLQLYLINKQIAEIHCSESYLKPLYFRNDRSQGVSKLRMSCFILILNYKTSRRDAKPWKRLVNF